MIQGQRFGGNGGDEVGSVLDTVGGTELGTPRSVIRRAFVASFALICEYAVQCHGYVVEYLAQSTAPAECIFLNRIPTSPVYVVSVALSHPLK